MIIASIDIGTNTVLLLIAEVDKASSKITPLLNEYKMPRIGRDLKINENISLDRIEKLFTILSEYKSIISKYHVDDVLVTATNALRIAANSTEIAERIKKQLSWHVNIISGKSEAEFAFLGAVPVSSNNNNLVIDIGGGSTELILGKENDIEYRKSFQIGSVSATENYLKNSPPLDKELSELKIELGTIFEEIKNKFAPDLTYSIAGTPTTLFCMVNEIKSFDDSVVEGGILKYEDIVRIIQKLKKLTPKEIINKYGSIMQGREDIILSGSIILLNIMKLLNLSKVIVSLRGIRYGAIVSFLKGMKNKG
ncbi:MAG: rod shape-determining protein [Bacteroidetes bacterium]|nr:rod shape-determining protein [Bacteroidota bacterium]